jgi:ribosomal protein L3 glutamine methyltransferase
MNIKYASFKQQSIQDCIDIGETLFIEAKVYFGHGTDNAADEALWLVFYQLGLTWDAEESVLQHIVSERDYAAIMALYERRIQERIPAAYLTGEAWFAGLAFIVNPDVLVPRSPLAELINLQFDPWIDASLINDCTDSGMEIGTDNSTNGEIKTETTKPLSILDLCTGSGCIGIASALYIEHSRVVLSDISAEAIDVARQNIERYQLESRVSAVISDLFTDIPRQEFDLIVSNPPYVDANDLAEMPLEYHAEPILGLASGGDGLDFTRRLLRAAPDYLSEKGVLIVEVGNSWVNLEAAFPQISFLWLEFEFGGHGVMVMTKAELIAHRALFV